MISLLLSLTLFGAEPTGLVMRIPDETSASTVHFLISLGGKTADSEWSDFLDHWTDLFDINRDGKLSRDEAEVVPAITNAAGSLIRVDFPVADVNVDGMVTRDELQVFYKSRGISGINPSPATHDRSAIQVGEILWERLDQDRDGHLSREELASASQLLNRWDRNEDECLSVQELPTQTVSHGQKSLPVIEWLPDQKETANSVLIPLRLDALNRESSDVRKSEDNLPAGLELLDGNRIRVRRHSTTIVVQLAEASVQKSLQDNSIYLAKSTVRKRLLPTSKPLKSVQTPHWTGSCRSSRLWMQIVMTN